MSIATTVLDFCTSIYEQTCAMPTHLELPPVAFDTLRTELAPSMRYDDGMNGDWPASPAIFVETGHGYLVIRRGRA